MIAISIPLTWSLVEPKRHTFHNTGGSIRGILEISHSALIRNARLRWLILFSGIIGAATLTMVWFIQPYLQRCGLPVHYFGFAWTALNLSVGFFSLRAHDLENRVSERALILLMLVAAVLGFFLTGYVATLWSIPVLILFYFVRGINNPIFTTYINRIVPGDRRATVLSLRQLVTRLVFCVTGPISGWVSDYYSQSTALYACGVVFLLAGGGMLLVRTQETTVAPLS